MKITLRLLAVAAAAAVIGVTPASAVIGGTPDTAHPYVGMSVFFPSDGGQPQQCSGFLISAWTYVTAGHCTAGADPNAPVLLFFGPGPFFPGSQPQDLGVAVANPDWNGGLAHDVGMVHLVAPMPGPYATVAQTGYLDKFATKRGQQDMSFTPVGYGLVDATPQAPTPLFSRFAGTVQLENLTAIDLLTTAAPGAGTGGSATCYGDSGGPVFKDGLVVALVSSGTKYCNGKAADFRLDTVESRTFLGLTP
jgi:Trypsin